MKKKVMLILSCLFLSIGFITAQTTRVSGVVVDDAGEPVISASVVVKGTTVGVMTDIEGKFSINVPSGKNTLVFTLVGMKTVEVKVSPNMRVVMETDAQLLEDVIVVGYGSARKGSTVIGSVSTVKGEAVELKPSANVMDAMQGKVAGMQSFTSSGEPGSVSSVYIRGVGSLNAGTQPLYVLDGAPVGSDVLLTVNQNDIESVNVLKDASATSIYGSRAANGVIYVTTKRGRVADKAVIRGSFMYGISNLARRVGNPMNAQELADFQLKYNVISQSRYDEYMSYGNDTKWQDYFFNDNAPTLQANLSVSGGGGLTTYYISAGYMDQEGTSVGSEYKKYNLRSNIETQATKWLRMGLNLGGVYDDGQESMYTYQASNYLAGGILGTLMRQPYYTPYDENGKKYDYIPNVNSYSPYYIIEKSPRRFNNAQVNGSVFVEISPIENLKIRSQNSLEAYDYRYTLQNYPSYEPREGVGLVQERFTRASTMTTTNTAEYKFTVNNDHNFIILGAQEAIQYKQEAFRAETTGQSDDRLMLLSAGLESSFLGGDQHSKTEYVFSSFFGRADYNYKEKYFADLMVRTDGSSRFGKDNKYATFVSGGLMWNIKKENFMADLSYITRLQLKGSVGSQGNSEIGNYAHLGLVAVKNYNAQPGWAISSAGNSDLRWEKQIKTDITLQAQFLNKYDLTFTYYTRKTKDMLLNTPLPYTTGFTSMMKNIGEMSNKGIEVELGANILSTKDYTLGANATLSYNKMTIDKLFYGMTEWPMYSYLTNYIVGQSLNFFMPKYAGIDPVDGLPMWYVPGTDNETTKTYSESLYQDTGKPRYPTLSGGFGLNASYKGIYMSADFAWVLNKYIVNNDRIFSENPYSNGNYNQSKDILDKMWEKPGDEGKMYSMKAAAQFDDHLLENASFLRLKNLTVGYSLPKTLLNKTNFFSAVRVFGTARNLFTITKYKGADPEINSNLTYGAYPNSRQYVFGLELTF